MKKTALTLALLTLPFLWGAATPPKTETGKKETPTRDLSLTLGDIDSDFDIANTHVNVRFNGHIPWPAPEVQDHGAFLQIPLQNTVILKSGEFIEGKGPYVAKMAVFQTSQDAGALRLFLRRDAKQIKEATKVDVLDDRIVVYIDHTILEKLGVTDHLSFGKKPSELAATGSASAAASTSTSTPAPAAAAVNESAEPAVASTSVSPVSSETSAATPSSFGFGRKTDVVQKKSVWIATAFALFFLLVGGLAYSRGRFFRRRGMTPAEQSVVMKTIAQYPLSPKQKLTLIQVGGEQILLGVSESGINYLTTIASQSYARQAVEAAPRAELTAKPGVTLSPQTSFSSKNLRPSEPARLKSEARQSHGMSFEQTLAEREAEPSKAKLRTRAGADPKGFQKSSKINVAIDDDGVHNLGSAPRAPSKTSKASPASTAANDGRALEDVTALIRRKLRDLPSR